jgi:hypothetical protein
MFYMDTLNEQHAMRMWGNWGPTCGPAVLHRVPQLTENMNPGWWWIPKRCHLNMWPSMPFLHHTKITVVGDQTRHRQRDKRSVHKTTVMSGRQEDIQRGPQSGLRPGSHKANIQVFHQGAETSDRTLWSSRPPPRKKKWQCFNHPSSRALNLVATSNSFLDLPLISWGHWLSQGFWSLNVDCHR